MPDEQGATKRIADIIKARKLWPCDGCERPICPGEFYTYEADLGSGANVKRFCSQCKVVTDA